jgi:3-oxoacyl-[acyl-carrier protein] reductase
MSAPLSISGQTVLVTGAGGGIGGAITAAFHRAGARVVATDLNLESLKASLAANPELEGVVPMSMNVTDEADVSNLFDEVIRRYGPVRALINNAGIKSAEPLLTGDSEKTKRTLEINADAILLCSRLAVSKCMKEAGGRIINIGSSLSSQGAVFNYQAGGADYCLSKAVVHDLTKLLAYECAPLGVNVNGIAPGIIDTPMHGRPRAETEARHSGRIPLGRVGVPEDISGLAVFLAGSGADYITGQIIHVNGGMLMNG